MWRMLARWAVIVTRVQACCAHRFNRRRLLAASGAGAASLALGGLGFDTAPWLAGAKQIDLPDLPTPIGGETSSATAETPADVASRLGYDRDAIVAFVRDEIAYESYAGVLRGASGALSARAGNAADQALLLAALFDASEIAYRIASGPLDPVAEEVLAGKLSLDSATMLNRLDAATAAAVQHALDKRGAIAADQAEVDAVMQDMGDSVRAAIDGSVSAAGISREAVAAALASGGITLPDLTQPSLTDWERLQHVWVQVPSGSGWADIDPTVDDPDIVYSSAGASSVVPPEWHHQVHLTIVAEEWYSGTLTRRDAVSWSITSAEAADLPIALSLATSDELDSAGLGLMEVLSGQKGIYATIYVDGATFDSTQPLLFTTDAEAASDIFSTGESTIPDGETLAVWLRVEIASPDSEPVVTERALLDRVPPEARIALEREGTPIDPTSVAPVQLVQGELGDELPVEFNRATVVHVDVARTPPVDALTRFFDDDVFGVLGLVGPALASQRDQLGLLIETDAGYWSYPSAPNITLFHAGRDAETGNPSLAVDLAYRARTSVPLTDAAPGTTAQALLISGIVDAVAEQAMLAPELIGIGGGNADTIRTGPTIGAIFQAATESQTPIRAVSTVDALADLDLDDSARRYLTMAIESGLVAIVPETYVELNDKPELGWWLFDPLTGKTRDQLQDGTAGASTSFGQGAPARLFQSTGEYSFLTRAIAWVVSNGRGLTCMAAGISVGIFLGIAVLENERGSGGGTLGGILGAAGAGALGGLAC